MRLPHSTDVTLINTIIKHRRTLELLSVLIPFQNEIISLSYNDFAWVLARMDNSLSLQFSECIPKMQSRRHHNHYKFQYATQQHSCKQCEHYEPHNATLLHSHYNQNNKVATIIVIIGGLYRCTYVLSTY